MPYDDCRRRLGSRLELEGAVAASIHRAAERDCLKSPDAHQTEATRANIEERGSPIFRVAGDRSSLVAPLQPSFQTVSEGKFSDSGLPVYGILGNSGAAGIRKLH